MSIKEIAPHLTPEECAEAEQDLRECMDVLRRIHKELRADPERYKEFKQLSRRRNR